MLGRSFMVDSDPAPTVETIKSTLKLYPYAQGGPGTSIATLLEGNVQPDPPVRDLPRRHSSRGAGRRSTRSRRAASAFFELLNELVQEEPAGSTDIELMGQLAAIGIVKGEPFEPDERMRRILEEAAAVGSATSRALVFEPRASEGFMYYDDGSAWFTDLFVCGYNFETPPPLVTEEGIKPLPATGVRKLQRSDRVLLRLHGDHAGDVHAAHGHRVAVPRRRQGRRRKPLDGAQSYRVTLPADIPAARFWSLTLYDTETRSMFQTPQRLPAGRQPGLPDAGGDRGRGRLDDRHVRSGAARRRARRATGSRRRKARAFRGPAPLQPAPAVLRQELAAERDRGPGLGTGRRWQ